MTNARVGDLAGVRDGDLTISFEAESAIGLDQVTVSVFGAIEGLGTFDFSETVEDLVDPGVIANLAVTVDDFADLPVAEPLPFSRTTTRVRVTKQFTFSAPDSAGSDLAEVRPGRAVLSRSARARRPHPADTGALAIRRR